MYYEIQPYNNLTASQRAEALSRELYCITLPRQHQTSDQHACNVFGVLMHTDGQRAALQTDLSAQIAVHPEANIDAYVNLLSVDTEDVRQLLTTSAMLTFSQIVTADFVPIQDINAWWGVEA